MGLIAVEVALRLADVSYPVFTAYDPIAGWKRAPGMRGRYREEGDAFVQINASGYRDEEHALEKPPGVLRIAVLGDSFTEALQIDLADTFWKRLESELGGCPALGGRRVEALSFGVSGYGSAQELLALQHDALRFRPDLVLLAFFAGNDLVDNSAALDLPTHSWLELERGARPYFALRGDDLVVDESFRSLSVRHLLYRGMLALAHHSRTLELASQRRRDARIRRGKQDASPPPAEPNVWDRVFLPPEGPAWTDAWRVTEALIGRMQAESHAAGAGFALVTLTVPVQVDPDPSQIRTTEARLRVEDLFYPERRLRTLGERSRFPVITLAERFQARAAEQHVFFHGFEQAVLGSGHWNAEGHRYAAELIAGDLCGSGALLTARAAVE